MGKSGGPSASTQAAETHISEEQTRLAEHSDARSQQLFDLSLPGFKTATDHYTKLASGDPNAIFTAVAPSVQGVKGQFDAAKQNIQDTMPRGGAKDLALEEASVSQAGTVGNIINTGYEGSFAALANLAGKGMGLSVNEVANAIGAFGGASNTLGNVAQQQQAAKSSSLGFIGSLLGSGAEMAGAFA